MLGAVSVKSWACCYVLVEDLASAEVAALAGGRLSGALLSERQATESSAPWPSVGPACEGWTVVVDPHFEFGDSDVELRQWSVGTRVVRLQVLDREAFSHASVWVGGEIAWDVSFDSELDDRPCLDGRFPYHLDELAPMIAGQGAEAWYRVPISAVQRVTGWHPRPAGDEADEQRFAELLYDRPAGVAAAVERDLGIDG